MTPHKRLRFGIKTAPQHTTYDEILRVWLEADGIPSLEHAWLFDHFVPLREPIAGPLCWPLGSSGLSPRALSRPPPCSEAAKCLERSAPTLHGELE